ncbi:MAG: homoserine O-succinyltransferase [Hyphomicrobiaceae bacterium]
MPIRIANDLPARPVLEAEGVNVMSEKTAARQDIRPLRIALLNLMPTKINTEAQFARLIGSTPLQVDLSLVRMTNHVSKNTSGEHMAAFYRPWENVQHEKFDGLIVTGAPIELLDFEDVSYWDELCQIFDWCGTNVHSLLAVCWGAQAALHHFYGVPKHELSEKRFGVFAHQNRLPGSPFLRGFSDRFSIPVSRWTEVREDDLPVDKGLEVLMSSAHAGLCLVNDPGNRALYMFNHIEYDTDTLGAEYARDVDAGKDTRMPLNYFPDDDPDRSPRNRWRSHAHLFFANWINETYQSTPFPVEDIGAANAASEALAS